MFTSKDVLETIAMVEKEHLDIRTITMGISLLSCIRDSAEETARKVYDLVCYKAKDIVKTAEELSAQYGIPIVNKRVSVTPVSMLCAAFPEKAPLIGKALDDAAATLGGVSSTRVATKSPAGETASTSTTRPSIVSVEVISANVIFTDFGKRTTRRRSRRKVNVHSPTDKPDAFSGVSLNFPTTLISPSAALAGTRPTTQRAFGDNQVPSAPLASSEIFSLVALAPASGVDAVDFSKARVAKTVRNAGRPTRPKRPVPSWFER
jgi:hypothetical protein